MILILIALFNFSDGILHDITCIKNIYKMLIRYLNLPSYYSYQLKGIK